MKEFLRKLIRLNDNIDYKVYTDIDKLYSTLQ